MSRSVCEFCGTRETRRNVHLRHVDDGCSGVHDYLACDACDVANTTGVSLRDGFVLWADGPLWSGRKPVTVDEESRSQEFYQAIRLLLDTGTGQVSLFDVSGDSEHYWLAEHDAWYEPERQVDENTLDDPWDT